MDYNTIKHELFCKMDKKITNNSYYFDIYSIQANFYNIYLSTILLLSLKHEDLFMEISILFEFLLRNYLKFSIIIDNSNKTDKNVYESNDVLCFLSINIFILDNLNTCLKKLGISDSVMQECLDYKNLNFMEVDNINYKDFKLKIIGVFNKLIEVYSKQSE